MAAPDLPVHLDEALRALDALLCVGRGVQVIQQFLESLDEMQVALPPAPLAPLEDYVAMENAYQLGARCVTPDGNLIVIPRVALLELLRKFRSIEP